MIKIDRKITDALGTMIVNHPELREAAEAYARAKLGEPQYRAITTTDNHPLEEYYYSLINEFQTNAVLQALADTFN